MAFTRFHDDPARIQKRLNESTQVSMYHLNTPGNGLDLPYINDHNIRLQKWGGNMQTNGFDIEQELRGYRKTERYDTQSFKHPKTSSIQYRNENFHIDETRASLPAWTFRDKTHFRPNHLFIDPQKNLFIPFENNCPSRILEKDYYTSPYYPN
jgi:hypothetical protein